MGDVWMRRAGQGRAGRFFSMPVPRERGQAGVIFPGQLGTFLPHIRAAQSKGAL